MFTNLLGFFLPEAPINLLLLGFYEYMEIDKYKVTINRFTAELDEPVDRHLRTLITAEVDIYDVSTPDNHDGTFDKVYKGKVNGTTILKQGEEKPPLVAKSKRSQSAKLRMAIAGEAGHDEEVYTRVMSYIIDNIADISESALR